MSLDSEFYRKRVHQIRELADRADPFIKRRLLDLAQRYEDKLGRPSPTMKELKLVWSDPSERSDGKNP
jgi:hypothetical protein